MLTIYHAPRSRSSRIIWLAEELGCDYKIEITPIVYGNGQGAPAPDSYAKVHPLKKVPAISLNGETVFESAAIVLYLTDAFQKHAVGPLPGNNNRAEYVRWLFFYSGILEPASTARMRGWDKDGPTGVGDFEIIEKAVSDQLAATPYMLGDEFSGADILFGSAVQFFKDSLFPKRKHYDDYLARLTARPAYVRAQKREDG
jgi:glutathione S-transferase